MDLSSILTTVGTGIGVVSLIYAILRNFKKDIYISLEEVRTEMNEMKSGIYGEFSSIGKELNSIDYHLSRIERLLEEREFQEWKDLRQRGTK